MLTLLLVNIGYEREFMITKCGLDELSVVVVDASLTELVLKHNDLITSAMYKRRCAVVVRFSRYAVFVLEVQAHNAHVEPKLLFVRRTRVVKVNIFQSPSCLAPFFLSFEDSREFDLKLVDLQRS